MTTPTNEQIATVRGRGRSPYIAIYPYYPSVTGSLGYCVDLHTDHQPRGTYLCPLNWWMDVSSLKARYARVYNDYTGTPGGYCGFQRLADGSRIFIMTVWSTFCKDHRGNVTIITPRVLYPENGGRTNRTMDEGNFVHVLLPYDWQPGKDYRVLLQHSVSKETGNTVLTAWVCDLSKRKWTMLASFDTGISGVCMSSCGAFLENFLTEYTGELRSMELFNLRAFSAKTMRWVAADTVKFRINGSVSDLGYIGSCSFGTDRSSIWAITSGVSGLCKIPSETRTYTLVPGDVSDPF